MPEPITHIPNEMVRASAGSGKTYRLTNRYIQLLARGDEEGNPAPERIVALTFTRAAAGEFLDSILQKLAEASASPEKATELAQDIDWKGAGSEDFLRLLRSLVECLHQLSLSTFHSFFTRIVRAFPIELGLAGGFTLIETVEENIEKQRALTAVFRDRLPQIEGADAFLEAFKRATFGNEEARLAGTLNRFIDQHHAKLIEAPNACAWGDLGTIWPDGFPYDGLETKDLETRLDTFLEAIRATDAAEKQLNKWEEFGEVVRKHNPGSPVTYGFLINNVLPSLPEIEETGEATVTVDRKKTELHKPVASKLRALLHSFIGREILVRRERTAGIHTILTRYEQAYDHFVRSRGKLTFSDLTRILLPPREDAAEGGGFGLGGIAESRVNIDYRLDASLDHWLLDEFQDTSRQQWKAIENLIDEAVQDPTGKRSLFVVGDIKQSIYAWRQGDHRLFGHVEKRYNAAGATGINCESLDRSYRSRPAVLRAVNQIFGDPSAFGDLLPAPVIATWESSWEEHESAVADCEGYAAWLPPTNSDKTEAYERTRLLLEEVRPVDRALSCCILVQGNQVAEDLLDYLREADCTQPCTSESDRKIADENPLCTALFSLLKFAAHPGDTLSWEHLQMTPFAGIIGGKDNDKLPLVEKVLSLGAREGFGAVIREWVKQVHAVHPLDPFSRARAEELETAARLFDTSGGDGIDALLNFLEEYKIRDIGDHGAVEIITIHRSKGLTFDMTILPDLGGTGMTSRGGGRNAVATAVKRAPETREIEWLLELPAQAIAQTNPELAARKTEEEEENGYEALCKLYVATTRPRYGLYLIAPKPKQTSKSKNYLALLASTLKQDGDPAASDDQPQAPLWETGEPDWFEAHPVKPPSTDTNANSTTGLRIARCPNSTPTREEAPPALTPSAAAHPHIDVENLLDAKSTAAMALGDLVHSLFEDVGWIEELPKDFASALLNRWAPKLSAAGEGAERATHWILEILENPTTRAVFSQNAIGDAYWNEREFDALVNGERVSGKLDRVLLQHDAEGTITKITVIDFKTDIVPAEGADSLVERYRPQLALYVDALNALFPEAEEIRAGLLLVKTAELIWV